MSFREKSAWVSFVCLLLLTFGVLHSMHFHTHDAQGHDVIDPLHLALAIFVGFIVLQVVLHLIIAAQSPKDARTPKDERERFIELRAARIGFYSLVVGELDCDGRVSRARARGHADVERAARDSHRVADQARQRDRFLSEGLR